MRVGPWNCRSDIAISAAALDAFVKIFVDDSEVIEYLPFILGETVELRCRHGGKLLGQFHEGLGVEFVLVRLEKHTGQHKQVCDKDNRL